MNSISDPAMNPLGFTGVGRLRNRRRCGESNYLSKMNETMICGSTDESTFKEPRRADVRISAVAFAAAARSTSVIVVAETPLAQAALAALVEDLDGVVLRAKLTPSACTASFVESLAASVVLWDTGTDHDPQLAMLRDGTAELPPVIALLDEHSDASRAWYGGVRGLLPRRLDAQTLHAALVAVARGLIVVHPRYGENVSARPDPEILALLTPREHEVMRLLAEGLPNKLIATTLDISEHTAKFHVNAILNKLGVHSRTEAVARAARSGIINL